MKENERNKHENWRYFCDAFATLTIVAAITHLAEGHPENAMFAAFIGFGLVGQAIDHERQARQ